MDPRVELLSAAQARGRVGRGAGAAAAMEAMLYLSPPPELAETGPVPEELLGKLGGRRGFDALLGRLRDLARSSRFAEAYAAGAAGRERFLALARAEAARDADAEALGRYLGRAPAQDCLFILAPSFDAGGMAMVMRVNSDGTDGTYVRFPVRSRRRGAEPYFGLDLLGSGVAHHWAHQATTPWLWAHAKEIEALGDRAARACDGGLAGSPLFCFEENLVQAVMLRLLRARDARAYARSLSEQAGQFPLLPRLCRALEDYERSRDRYPSLDAFYPRLLEAFGGAPAPGSIRMDPRVELLSAVQALAEPPKRLARPYARRMAEAFVALRGHPAVAAYAALARGPDRTALMEAMLYLSDPPQLRPGFFPDDLARRAGGRPGLEDFLGKLRDFARAADFAGFWAREAGAREELIRRGEREAAKDVPAAELAAYLGRAPSEDAVFILAPAFDPGGARMAVRVNPDGSGGVFVRFPLPPRGGGAEPYFGLDQPATARAHEWAHQATAPWTAAREAEIGALGEPLARACGRTGFGGLFCFEEYLVQAVMLRVLSPRLGARGYGELLARQSKAFPALPRLCRALEGYESRRDAYPTLEPFYPRILDAFR